MNEPVGPLPQDAPGSGPSHPAISSALSIAFVGHLVALVAAATDSVAPNVAAVGGIACSIIAMAAWTELAPLEQRARRAVAALIGGHGAAAAVMVTGIAPSAP